MSLRVIKAGLLSTVQDSGRDAQSRLGVAPSGAMDRPALRLANALVGNAANAAALELTVLGPVLQFECDCVVALTGAPIDARIDTTQLPLWRPLRVPAGATLKLAGMRQGARSYLAIAGGLRAQHWLGSASVDLNAGIGSALRAGERFEIAAAPTPQWLAKPGLSWPTWSLAPTHWFEAQQRPLRVVPGVHFDALDAAARSALYGTRFRIGADSNRIGFRLQGATLELSKPLELVSEAVDFGTMQLPPGGDPIVLMAEHPTTGGYPRIAQVAAVDLPYLAQRRPGDDLYFEHIDAQQAECLLIRQEQALDELIAELGRRLAAPGEPLNKFGVWIAP